jgi:hypothetical protein
MAYKITSRGEEYVPRGYTVDPCPGCGGDEKRKKDKVCPICASKIEKWDAQQKEQAALGQLKPFYMQERDYALPYIHNIENDDKIRNLFWRLSYLLSRPSEATWKEAEGNAVWPHERMNTFRNEWRIIRDMDPTIANLLGDLYFEVATATDEAHKKGVTEGKNLLLSLAGGHITNDEFNRQAARLTGQRDEE